MDSRNGRARNERRASAQEGPRMSLLDHGLSDDDYDLDEMTVANGFRPADPENGDSSSSTGPPLPSFPIRNDAVPKRHSNNGQRPSSVSKPSRHHDSLALQNDGSFNTGDARLYSRRMANDAAASSQSGHAPTHPYTLYTQNTTNNVEDAPSSQIPVGFHGLDSSYTRQIGPDGEETGGLLGPLGHTEELPPYSRYPELEYSSRDVTTAMISEEDDSNSPPSAVDGAGGIGLATRNPEFSGTEESLRRPRSQQSGRSRHSEDSVHDINVAAVPLNEKRVMTRWQRRARRKLWGIIPYWAICLMTVGMAIMGIVCGAVIGTLLHKNHQLEDSDNELKFKAGPDTQKVALTTVPPNLPAIPVGKFQLPHLDVSQAPRSCFKDPSQSMAWTCSMPYRYYQLDVETIPGAPDVCNHNLRLEAINSSDSMFIYGTQPPNVTPGAVLQLVNDTFEMGRGPAWWLQVGYDKTIILREEDFPGGKTSNDKRGWGYGNPFGIFAEAYKPPSSIAAQAGDMPWICKWPETTLDIFIYPSQNISRVSSGNSPYSGSHSTSTSHSDASSPLETALPFTPPPPFPKVIKFLERRISDKLAAPATCKQYEIIDGGYGKQPVLDDHGKPIAVTIQENLQDWTARVAQLQKLRYGSVKRESPSINRRHLELTDCGCLWWSLT